MSDLKEKLEKKCNEVVTDYFINTYAVDPNDTVIKSFRYGFMIARDELLPIIRKLEREVHDLAGGESDEFKEM